MPKSFECSYYWTLITLLKRISIQNSPSPKCLVIVHISLKSSDYTAQWEMQMDLLIYVKVY